MPPFTKDGNAQSGFALHLNCHLTRPPPTGPSTANRFRRGEARSRGSKRSLPNFRPQFTSGYAPANGGWSDRSAVATASSNCCSSQGDIRRRPATTFLAHSMYSNRRLTDQSAAGLDATARRLLVLSANLISLASLLFFSAVSICLRFRSSFGSVLSSVTSMTISATCFPNRAADEHWVSATQNKTANSYVVAIVI